MAWTAPKTWSGSEVLDAADLNAKERDNLNYLYSPGACSARRTGVQAIAYNTVTSIVLDVEDGLVDIDTNNMHSTVTNPSRITFDEAGVWLVTGGFEYLNVGTSAFFQAMIRKNGSVDIAQQGLPEVGTGAKTSIQVQCLRLFSASDYVELMAYHLFAITEEITSAHLSVVRLRGHI